MKNIQSRTKHNRLLFLEQLNKVPIIQVVCERMEISRSTYYRWRDADKKFALQADKALRSGIALINDLAESQLLNAIKNHNITAVMYWLNHRHSAYSNKIEVTAKNNESLSKSQEKLIIKALEHASLIRKENSYEPNK